MSSPFYRSRREATAYLVEQGFKISPSYLKNLARRGPAYRLYGRDALYTAADLDAWIESKKR